MPKGIKGYQKGHKGFLTPEHYKRIGEKISISQTGRVLTDSDKLKISLANKGRVPWNKGLKTGRNLKHTRAILAKNPMCLFSDSLRIHSDHAGIYGIINRNNGKIYIGSSINIMARMNQHRSGILLRKHNNRYLRRAVLKEPEAFEFSVIEKVSNIEDLAARETFWIKFYNSNCEESGYNLAPVGGSNRGIKFSKEARANISAGLRKRWGKR